MTDPNVAAWLTEYQQVRKLTFLEPDFDAYDRQSPKADGYADELRERADDER